MSLRRVGLLWIAIAGLVATSAVAQEPPPVPSVKPGLDATDRARTAKRLESGGSNISYYRVGAAEFLPVNDATAKTAFIAFSEGGGFESVLLRFSPDSGPLGLVATPHLPGGALLTSLELDSCDHNTQGLHITLVLREYDYHGIQLREDLANLSSKDNIINSFGCGFVFQDLSGLNYTVNNNYYQLVLFAKFSAVDNSTSLAGATIGYQLQVSPDSATQTFSDVPAEHPFHRFVEALYEAGLTVGYPDGRYGVDDPITRGQMAVFLSKALGLSWSQ